MQLNPEVLGKLTQILSDSFATKSELDAAVARLTGRTGYSNTGNSEHSLSRMIRGLLARQGHIVNETEREADLSYVQRALATTSTPGSYLVPTIQANDIIQILTTNGVFRAIGPRTWPMTGIQKLTIPTAMGLPTVQYLGQNTAQTAADPNLGQVSFDLKTARALTQVPLELLRVSVPAMDSVLTELLGIAFAESEDLTVFGSAQQTNGPMNLTGASVTQVMVGGSPNGGNLAYGDLLNVLKTAAANKAKPPYVWVMSPRTFWQRVAGLVDNQSRPIFLPGYAGLQASQDLNPGVASPSGKLFGWPVYVTPFISETETNGSGTNQSHIVFCNPKYCHLAEDTGLQIQVSLERYFESNQAGIRGVHQIDTAFAPAAGIVTLCGVN
jgi:HK97 family phage major capsid protein